MLESPSIMWFRNDLRISDNPAFVASAQHKEVIPIYIYDESYGEKGGASKVWLHHSLIELGKKFQNKLQVFSGDSMEILSNLCVKYNVTAVYGSEFFDPKKRKLDDHIRKRLDARGIQLIISNSTVLWHPESIKDKEGKVYEVFSPYYRKGCLKAPSPKEPLGIPAHSLHSDLTESGPDRLKLLPKEGWDKHVYNNKWKAGSDEAEKILDHFLIDGVKNYKSGRNFPAENFVSRLSPHIAFGEISINEVWYKSLEIEQDKNVEHFRFELGWREFSYYQLYHWPSITEKNIKTSFDGYPWGYNESFFQAWCRGQTGVPIVDAGMRELWQTGYINNRVRLLVASFLVDYLMIDWRHGLKWFDDTLFDADTANNAASWQWVAGCGLDPVDYPRIFNPVTQSKKFDSDGVYIRRFIPELSELETNEIHAPWLLSEDKLKNYGLTLGKNYPRPIVDLEKAYNNAKKVFEDYFGKG